MSLGALQSKQIQKIQNNLGNRWVGPGLTRKKRIGKSSPNTPIIVLTILVRITMCILKVVSHYDLSVLFIPVMGCQKRSDRAAGGWVGGVSSIQFLCAIFLTLQSPLIQVT